MKLVFALLLGALTAHAADNSPLVHLSFQRSLQAGVRTPTANSSPARR